MAEPCQKCGGPRNYALDTVMQPLCYECSRETEKPDGILLTGTTIAMNVSSTAARVANTAGVLIDQIQRLKAHVKSQEAALHHWRRLSDQDAGKMARYSSALFRIAHGRDDLETIRELAKQELSNMPPEDPTK